MRSTAPDDVTDPAIRAIAALVQAASIPMAVFDDQGACLAANRDFALAPDRHPRTAFSPDGQRRWSLAAPHGGPAAAIGLDTLAHALPLMLNVKDRQSRYLFMNRYQAALYGVTPEGAVGRTAGELLGSAYGGYARSRDLDVLEGAREPAFYEESYAGVDGVERHWLTAKAPLAHADGAAWGVATVAVDISERKALERRLREVEAGSRAKSRFLAGMSHELRTPLNAVIGFAELMEQEALGPLGHADYREFARHIHLGGLNLLRMITDLLDFARLEAGTLALTLGEVDMARLLRGVVAAAAAEPVRSGKPQIRLELAVAHLPIRCDEARVRQVFASLLDNAVKFTASDGRVEIRLRASPGGAEVTIADTGIGMSEEELQQAFEPFWQADSGLGRKRGGAGIGLRLARDLVALHGGSLTLESRKGDGTRVTVLLPHSPPPRKPPPG